MRHAESPVLVDHLAVGHTELLCRVWLGDLDQLLGEQLERAPGPQHAARAAGAVADEIRAGRSGMKTNVIGGNAHRLCDDLREHRLVPLSGRLRHGVQRHLSVCVEFHRDLILRREPAAAGFEISRDADAAELPRALRRGAPLRKARPFRAAERVFHDGPKSPESYVPAFGVL